MPIFEYDCEKCGPFEVFRKASDEPLEKCPTCDGACRRVYSSFAVGGKEKSLLSKKNLEAHGFTQYTRKGKGYYEKTAGKGPAGLADGSSK